MSMWLRSLTTRPVASSPSMRPRRRERRIVHGAKQQDVAGAEDHAGLGMTVLVADAHDQDVHP